MTDMERAREIAARLTPNQRDCLLHTLGMRESATSHRNYFCAGEDTADDAALHGMEWLGVTECYMRPGQREGMPYRTYAATPLGLSVAQALTGNAND